MAGDCVELEYSSKKLEGILTNPRLIKKYYGVDATRLMNRLSELRAALSLEMIPNVPPPRRHKLTGDFKDCWGIDFSANRRIIIAPIGEFLLDDLSTIKKIQVLILDDYH